MLPFHGSPVGSVVLRRPTTLSARAAQRLEAGPLDAVTLMRDVCQVARLQTDAAERMAEALLSSHAEFVRLPSGHWSLRTAADARPREPVAERDAPSPSLTDVSFAVVDVETTGTRASATDRITEIAIAQVHNGEVADVYSQLVNPERSIPPHITSLTQISWAMVRDQPTFRHIIPEVSSRLAGHVFTAHNAVFDWRFVSEGMSRGAGVMLAGPRLCTVRLARALLPQLSRRSLDHVTNYFGIEIDGRHRAEGDAVATARALIRMLGVAGDRGISTWTELERLLSSPGTRRGRTASDRRRRAFPLPATTDDIA